MINYDMVYYDKIEHRTRKWNVEGNAEFCI